MFFCFKKGSVLKKSIWIAVLLTWLVAPVFATASKASTQHHKTIKHAAAKHKHSRTKKTHHLAHHSKHHSQKLAHNNKPVLQQFASSPECIDPALSEKQVEPSSNAAMRFASSVETHLVDFVHKTVNNLHYSRYKLGGKSFDPERGVYVVDCSSFVDHILQANAPNAYSSLVNATGATTPATSHYYNFFSELSEDPDSYWNKIDDISQLQPGDILVFRYKNSHGMQTGGHVMVVMNKPIRDANVYLVRVADSAASGHSEDTRGSNTSGIGIGTLLLKANPKTGKPAAYAWGLNGYWNRNVSIAMARPVDMG